MSERKSQSLKKVTFFLNQNEWHGYASETIWAEQTSGNCYRLRNTPFYAKGVSLHDVVCVKAKNHELIFDYVAIRGGHSTYRLLVDRSRQQEIFLQYWQPLQELGCSYETAEGRMRLYAIDVPPSADIYKVYSLLEKGETDGIWEFEEGHCGHPLKARSSG